MNPPDTKYARSGDVWIAYQTFGEGPIDLLMFHGAFIPIDAMWDEPTAAEFFERLAKFSRVILFDKRGQGMSDPLPAGEPFTLEWWVEDARAVLDAVGSERPAVFGTVHGGPASLLFAATEPNRVSALILVATWARMAVSEDMPWGTTVEQSAEQERLILEDFGTAFPRQIATGEVAAEQRFLAWLRRAIQRGSSPMRALALWRMSFEVDVRSVLSAISVPTLVMFGPRPRDLAEHGRYLAAEIDGAQQVELPKLGIWSFNDRSGVREEIEAFLTGARPAPMSDRVFATLMFTDVVSSTPRTVELGDRRWKQLLDRHDDVVRRDVERFRGNVVNTTGDGVLARFDGPARAVRCAQSVTSALRAHEIEIRAGLHAGEVETRGNDVTGIAVNIASRVSSLAEPGEILVSRTITDLVAGSGLEFEDRGDHELKGVPGRWQLYAVKS